MQKLYASLAISLIVLLSAAAVQAQADGKEDRAGHSLADAVLGALTPQQADQFLAGADPSTLRLEDGKSLAEFIAMRAIDTDSSGAYHPLPNCLVVRTVASSSGMFAGDESRQFLLRGPTTDLSDQGGDAAGCGVSDDATAAVLNLNVRNGLGAGAAYAYAVGGGSLVRPVLHFDAFDLVNNMVIVPMGKNADWAMRLTAPAHVVAHVVGYFSPVRPEVLFASVSHEGPLLLGNAIAAERTSIGRYRVTFGRDLSNCVGVATTGTGGAGGFFIPGAVANVIGAGSTGRMGVWITQVDCEQDGGCAPAAVDSAFNLVVVCR